MLCTVALVLALAPAAEPASIYVGPTVRSGFVDIDKGVRIPLLCSSSCANIHRFGWFRTRPQRV
jgi:hypothetical protein